MANRKVVERSWKVILNQVGRPSIRLVSEMEFRSITGYWNIARSGPTIGFASPPDKIIAIQCDNIPRGKIKLTLWHELAHCLFPKARHWWIECFAAKMTRKIRLGLSEPYSIRYHHNTNDLPSRAKCLELAQCAAKHIK